MLNSNYKAYLKANSLEDKESEVKMWEFIEWVNIKASKFRRLNGLEPHHPISRLASWANYIEKGE